MPWIRLRMPKILAKGPGSLHVGPFINWIERLCRWMSSNYWTPPNNTMWVHDYWRRWSMNKYLIDLVLFFLDIQKENFINGVNNVGGRSLTVGGPSNLVPETPLSIRRKALYRKDLAVMAGITKHDGTYLTTRKRFHWILRLHAFITSSSSSHLRYFGLAEAFEEQIIYEASPGRHGATSFRYDFAESLTDSMEKLIASLCPFQVSTMRLVISLESQWTHFGRNKRFFEPISRNWQRAYQMFVYSNWPNQAVLIHFDQTLIRSWSALLLSKRPCCVWCTRMPSTIHTTHTCIRSITAASTHVSAMATMCHIIHSMAVFITPTTTSTFFPRHRMWPI